MNAETKTYSATNKIDIEDPATWLDAHGDRLFRFAVSRVRNRECAEDLVQETLLAAMQNIDSFDHGSTVRTWLTGILKHKIVDHFRRAAASFEEASDWGSEYFGEDGHWLPDAEPSDWGRTPEEMLSEREFYVTLAECISRMPLHLAAVFSMHEFEGLDSSEICERLSITPANYWVMMHRARLHLRRELEKTLSPAHPSPIMHPDAIMASV
jgi:RNA polymerase sigma-70 factor (TIGR02943 family)